MKKIVGLLLAMLLLAGMGGIGTWAYFSDVEITNSNITAGTLDLKTDDVDGVTQTLIATNLSPGTIIGTETITLKNSGSLAGSSLDLSFAYSENDSSPNPVDKSANATAAVIQVLTLEYDGTDLLTGVNDSNSNSYKDVQDLAAADLSGLAGISASAEKDFDIAVQLRSDISKDFQSDGITVTISFLLNQ